MINKQRGFIDLPRGFLETLLVMAGIGLISLLVGIVYVIWWIINNVTISIG